MCPVFILTADQGKFNLQVSRTYLASRARNYCDNSMACEEDPPSPPPSPPFLGFLGAGGFEGLLMSSNCWLSTTSTSSAAAAAAAAA